MDRFVFDCSLAAIDLEGGDVVVLFCRRLCAVEAKQGNLLLRLDDFGVDLHRAQICACFADGAALELAYGSVAVRQCLR